MPRRKTPEAIKQAAADAPPDKVLGETFPASDPLSSLPGEPDEPPKPA
jgi:hypothetical protein